MVSASIKGKRVFLTGHTGFTGSWLALWLAEIGCETTGFSLAPDTEPSLYEILGGDRHFSRSIIADIRDFKAVRSAMAEARPDLVIHLAAQPLVRRSYREPLETISTNVVGTANVLEAARLADGVSAFVCVTTDKVYENVERELPYREDDRLGGKDPYSASKACAEIITRSYQERLACLGNGVCIATARGGNIIGGGDWSEDRIVPDFYRAATSGARLSIRNPDAVRPWQHVLSACHGYLAIAGRLMRGEARRAEAFNIGPAESQRFSVRQLVEALGRGGMAPPIEYAPSPLKEDSLLTLDASKAQRELSFSPPWSTEETFARTSEWYLNFYSRQGDARNLTAAQLRDYRAAIGDA
jgi:CDP-glucose 4,6-dehydratase